MSVDSLDPVDEPMGSMRHSQSDNLGRTVDDLILANPRYSSGSLASLRRLNIHDRASSDTTLAHATLQSRSRLTVDKYEFTLGSGDNLKVMWDIKDDCGATDWIGLFLFGK